MPVQIIEPSNSPEATYKAREVEGILDLYFYRKIGFWLAQFFARLNVTPAGVSLFGALCGVIAGHLYFYRNLSTNRSEEHTSELQSRPHLVCRLLLEKKK